MQFIIYFLTFLFIGISFYRLIKFINEDEKSSTKVDPKMDSEYYYYNFPQKWIMNDGKEFNIPDYIPYEWWKKSPRDSQIKMCIQIENRLRSRLKENNDNDNKLI